MVRSGTPLCLDRSDLVMPFSISFLSMGVMFSVNVSFLMRRSLLFRVYYTAYVWLCQFDEITIHTHCYLCSIHLDNHTRVW
nr:MAG TPA: hypothetical protein [Caudoviricetes sp.]